MEVSHSPEVSVIIPVHNMEKYVERAIRSVLVQTGISIEVIVIDDASIDNSVSIVEQIQDARINLVILEDNVGVAAARNIGISLARGEWIQFLDPDDILDPCKLVSQLSVATISDVVVGRWRKRHESTGNVIEYVPNFDFSSDAFRQLIAGNRFPVHALIVRRSMVLEIGGFDSAVYHEDWDFWVRLAALKARFSYVPDSSVEYLIRPGSRCGDESHRLEKDLEYLGMLPNESAPAAVEDVDAAKRIRIFRLAYINYLAGKKNCAQYWKGQCDQLSFSQKLELILVSSSRTAWLSGKLPGPKKIRRIFRRCLSRITQRKEAA